LLGGAVELSLSDVTSSRGDAKSSLGDAKSSLGDAKSSLGDAKSSLGDAKSSLGDAESSLGDAKRKCLDSVDNIKTLARLVASSSRPATLNKKVTKRGVWLARELRVLAPQH
jgi:uncharacterized protein YjbJ (UPF0337 family)